MSDTAERASFSLVSHNPDVLTCIANLSNDEVFTPPAFANRMLDTLETAWAESNGGASIWADPAVSFLDPFTKSGVFLREIVARLTRGLSTEIPDLQERVDHILTKQVFGIAITTLTSLLARRSLYCSKHATGVHSIAKSFDRDWGNVWFERTEHTWAGSRCAYCGANKAGYERSDDSETYAYAFTHTSDIRARIDQMFGAKMQFDVIIGNPPYQLSDGGFGISAQPIYHRFIEQAKQLEPRYLSLVTPARWFAGGKGLDEFRDAMLSDDRLRVLVDYPDSNDVFPGTQIKGGVAYWLWDRDSPGLVDVSTVDKGGVVSRSVRRLREPGAQIFVRYNLGVSIARKVFAVELGASADEVSFALPPHLQFKRRISSRRPFGFDTTFKGHAQEADGDAVLYRNGGSSFVARADVQAGRDVIDAWKVFIARAGSGSDSFPHPILSRPFLGRPNEVSSETYIYIGPLESETETLNVMSYLRTRLLRFLVLLHKPSQSTTREQYTLVPDQDFSRPWSDADLYAKYGLDDEEIQFIESLVRPMAGSDAED